MSNDKNKLGIIGLIALTVSAVLGGGIFNIMQDFARTSSIGPTIIALIISGIGMGVFVLCLQQLNSKYPDLDSGIYSYVNEAMGGFASFISAFGYWLSLFIGNVAYGALVFSSLSYFIPFFGDGQNIQSMIGASIILWLMHYVILKGAGAASFVNSIITIAKIIPIFIFIITILIAFDYNMFSADFWGTVSGNFEWSQVTEQVRYAMVSAVWIFLGVEGAVVFSARAKNRKILGQSIIMSFILITVIYLLTTVLSFAVMSQSDIANLNQPAMAGILESVVGPWGGILINLGVLIAVFGAWFSCTMLGGEITYQAAKDNIFPKVFAKTNKNGAPVNALIITNTLVQIFFFLLIINDQAYNFAALIASIAMLVPYLFVSIAHVILTKRNHGSGFNPKMLLGIVSTIYMCYCIYAGGPYYFLMTCLLFAPSILIYMKARKENQEDSL